MGFSRQEYWSGLPCPPPGDLPDPGIEPTTTTSPALAGRFFTTSATILHKNKLHLRVLRASLVARTVKCLLTMWETQVQFLGREDSPGEGNGNPLQHSCLENPLDEGA